MKLVLILLSSLTLFVPIAHAAPEHSSLVGCLYGVSSDGGAFNIVFLLDWDDARDVYAGRLEVYDPTSLTAPRTIHVIAYHLDDGLVWSNGVLGIDINNDPEFEGAGEPLVYLVGGYVGAAPETLTLYGTFGTGVGTFAGTMSAHDF